MTTLPRFRFIDAEGREHHLADSSELLRAVREGRLVPDTMLFDRNDGKWHKASAITAFEIAATAGAQDAGTHADPDPSPAAVSPRVTSETPPRRSKLPDVLGIFIWLVALYIGYRAQAALDRESGYAMGYALGQGTIVALIGMLIARIRPLKRRVWLAQALPGVLFLLVASVSLLDSLGQVYRTQNDAATAALLMMQGDTAAPASPSSISDTTSLAFIFASLRTDVDQGFSAYGSAMDSLGNGWLAPTVLTTPRGRYRARRLVGRLSTALTVLDTAYAGAMERTRARLSRLEASNDRWRGVVEGFEEAEPQNHQRIADFVRAERRLVGDYRSLLSLVTDTRPVLSEDRSTLLFSRQSDANRYNGLLAEIRDATQEEQTALTALQQAKLEGTRVVDSVRSMIGR